MITLDSLKAAKYKNDKINAIETVTAKFKVADIKKILAQQQEVNKIGEREAKREVTFLWIKIAAGILFLFSVFLLYSYINRKKLVVSLTEKNKQYLEAKENSDRLSKAKSILFSNITHELRTPMYGIIGISNILLHQKEDKHRESNLQSLKFSAEYLLALINNILQFNKLDSGSSPAIQSKTYSFDLRELVQGSANLSKYLSEKNPNTYTIDIENSIPNIIIGDRIKLSQILINLFSNAAKFTNDGVISITINSSKKDNRTLDLHFVIDDNGIGISEDKQKFIFDEYVQIGEGENFMGTGLGLPIVKKLLTEIDKDLLLKSVVGKGTTVSFSMEFTLPENEAIAVVPDYKSIKPFKGSKILIVDDNKINLLVSSKFIEEYGGLTTIADNGFDAIALEKEEAFDLILMDINMPDINGFETTSKIRENNSSIPIIALTAVEKEKVVGQELFTKMNDIIIKPFNENKVVPLLLQYLNK
ncbi:MAG: signal transduction histidine kinase/CheY-like chemotaxis protein [Dokdonia sp.]|jgi:signal transduction histidine kinase/CheY-like chemotaxis protein